jgi:RNA polymerase sigma factor (sigma-70 family)
LDLFLVDHSTIESLASGNREAFRQVYHAFKDKVYNTALAYVRLPQEAEEIVQDVFVEIHRSAKTFRQESSISTWIYRITINKCIDQTRSARRKKRLTLLTSFFQKDTGAFIDIPHFDHPGIALENKEDARLVFQAIDALSEPQKSAFILSQIEELPQKEIADILKVSEKALESLLNPCQP